jgi:hypothetical protein
MKRTALFISLLLVAGSIQAQDIFKKHGFNKEPLTLSKGRYKETFTNDEVMQIGTVLFNTRTNKVIQFLEEDTTEFAYKAESAGRFLTIDPLAEKYPWLSPYVYCNNNPVNYIDPTGMDWYQAENGNVMWRRSQDKDYTDDDGNVWNNIGTEYLFHSVLFKQRENEDGKLTLYSTTDTKEIGKYIGREWSKEHPLTEQGLEYDNTLFDLIFLGKGLFSTFSKAATEVVIGNAAKEGTSLIPMGLGSTGRTVAANLTEQLAMEEAMSNPAAGKIIMQGLKDARWLGWSKMQYTHTGLDGSKTVIHYVGKFKNGVLKYVDDFKFK